MTVILEYINKNSIGSEIKVMDATGISNDGLWRSIVLGLIDLGFGLKQSHLLLLILGPGSYSLFSPGPDWNEISANHRVVYSLLVHVKLYMYLACIKKSSINSPDRTPAY